MSLIEDSLLIEKLEAVKQAQNALGLGVGLGVN